MSATLSRSAYDLTLGDFYWLMYWQYVNSYKRLPKTVTWTCTNEEHMNRVGSGELAPDSLENVSEVKGSNLIEKKLDADAVNAFAQRFFDTWGLYLDLPRVSDLVETEDEKDPDADWYSKYTSVISREHYGAQHKRRRDYLRGWFKQHPDPDVLSDFEDWIDLTDHGVEERVKVTCQGCGVETQVDLRVTPLMFLPKGYSRNR